MYEGDPGLSESGQPSFQRDPYHGNLLGSSPEEWEDGPRSIRPWGPLLILKPSTKIRRPTPRTDRRQRSMYGRSDDTHWAPTPDAT